MKISFLPQNKKSRNEAGLAILSGVLLGISFPPFHFYSLAFIALIPFFIALNKKSGLAEINRLTYLFAFVFNLITLYWVGSWTKDADPFLMLSGTVLLFFNPLLFLVPSSLFYLAKKHFSVKLSFMMLPFFWVTYEFLYSVTDFRFPWLTLGNSQPYFTSFIQIADIIGVYGLSLLIIFINIFIYWGFSEIRTNRKLSDRYFTLAVLLFVIPILYSYQVKEKEFEKGTPLKVGLIQPDLNPWKKWDAGNLDQQIDLYLNLSRKAISKGARLIVFPESALPVYLTTPSYSRHLQKIHDFVDSTKAVLLTGMPDINFYNNSNAPLEAKKFKNGTGAYTSYNAAYLFLPGVKEIQEYHKVKLVPFGEKIPLVDEFPFLEKFFRWNVGISGWNVGEGAHNLAINDSLKLGAVICIESIYPEYVSEFVMKGANLLAVITNDSWYGKTSGPYQHAAYAILRAVENRRFVIRAANGGISEIISPTGKVISQTKLFTKTFLVGNVYPLYSKTFYTVHPYITPFLSILISLFILMSAIFTKLITRKVNE